MRKLPRILLRDTGIFKKKEQSRNVDNRLRISNNHIRGVSEEKNVDYRSINICRSKS